MFRRRRRSLETIEYSDGDAEKGDCWQERAGGGRRVSNRKRLTKLLEGAKLQVFMFLYTLV